MVLSVVMASMLWLTAWINTASQKTDDAGQQSLWDKVECSTINRMTYKVLYTFNLPSIFEKRTIFKIYTTDFLPEKF